MVRVLPRDAVTTITQLLPKLDAPHFAPSKEIADRIVAILEVVDQVPDKLLVLDSAQYTAFVANRAALRQLLAEWTGGTSSRALAPIKGFSQNPIVVIRDALAACPNEVILPGTAELPFLENDPELQASLRLDLSHAERALVNGEWKAATVLAGSVLEALLLWALAQHASAAAAATKAPKKPLDEDSDMTMEVRDGPDRQATGAPGRDASNRRGRDHPQGPDPTPDHSDVVRLPGFPTRRSPALLANLPGQSAGRAPYDTFPGRSPGWSGRPLSVNERFTWTGRTSDCMT